MANIVRLVFLFKVIFVIPSQVFMIIIVLLLYFVDLLLQLLLVSSAVIICILFVYDDGGVVVDLLLDVLDASLVYPDLAALLPEH
jgi:hypothetical protein